MVRSGRPLRPAAGGGILPGMSVAGTAVVAPAPRGGARLAIGTVGVAAGAALVVVAAAMPWATLLHGRLTVYGVQGDGAYLCAAALGAGALWMAFLLRGRPRPLRTLAAVTALVVLYWAVFDIEHIVNMVIDDPLASVMGWPLMGPGPLVTALGGAVMLAGALTAPTRAARLGWDQRLGLLLGAALLVAGAVHLQQVPAHLETSRLVGIGVAAAAAAQLGLGAGCLVVRRSRVLWVAAAVVSLLLLGVFGVPASVTDAAGAAAASLAIGLAAALTLTDTRRGPRA